MPSQYPNQGVRFEVNARAVGLLERGRDLQIKLRGHDHKVVASPLELFTLKCTLGASRPSRNPTSAMRRLQPLETILRGLIASLLADRQREPQF